MTNTNVKTYTAENVAKYFIFLSSKVVGDNREREGITNLKLQKVLYFAQAYFVAKLERTLFRDKIEAWEYGPVIPTVYHKYKGSGNQPIVTEIDGSSIQDTDKKILEMVWGNFGGYSASRLVDISHAHKPWKEAFGSGSNEISRESLAEYYAPLLNK